MVTSTTIRPLDRAVPVFRTGAGFVLVLCLSCLRLLGAPGSASTLSREHHSAPPSATNQLSVAVLGFNNQTGDTNMDFWRAAIEQLLEDSLGEAKALRLAPGTGYALNSLRPESRARLGGVEQARQAGELIEARRVIWGSYERQGKKWLVRAVLLNVATGNVSPEFTATSDDWFQLRDSLTQKILAALAVVPTPEEEQKMTWRWTRSALALELLSKQAALSGDHPLEEGEALLRGAIAADTSCAVAWAQLGSVLLREGKPEECEKAAREAIRLKPDYGVVHTLLGAVLTRQKRYPEAEDSFRTALRLEPQDSSTYDQMGEMYEFENHEEQAIAAFEQAARLDPFSAAIQGRIGEYYARHQAKDLALSYLKQAERFASPDDANAQQFLAVGFGELNDLASAVRHFDQWLTNASKEHLNPELLAKMKEGLEWAKARQKPVFVNVTEPQRFTERSLEDYLRRNLSPEQVGLMTNPLACTPEMSQWALALTAGATNDLQKAGLLVEALASRSSQGYGSRRTAQQVFASWKDPKASFLCSEYANLYVALGRAAGLRTYWTLVEEDEQSNKISHACACVFLKDRALLADPLWKWLGVPHHRFRVLDDVETLALLLTDSGDLKFSTIARHLAPQLPPVQGKYICDLIKAGRFEEAQANLPFLAKLDTEGSLTNMVRGLLAQVKGDNDSAIKWFQKAVSSGPMNSDSYYLCLGAAYAAAGKLTEARDAFRQALSKTEVEQTAEYARAQIAQINEAVGAKEAVSSEPKDAAGDVQRGDTRLLLNEFDKAIEDYTKAIQADPHDATAFSHRASAYYFKHDLDKALTDYTRAIAMDSQDSQSLQYRANVYAQKGETQKAIDDLTRAVEVEPKAETCIYLASLLLQIKNPDSETIQKALAAARKACELTNWSNWQMLWYLVQAEASAGDYAAASMHAEQLLRMDSMDENYRKSLQQWLDKYEAGVREWQPVSLARSTSVAAPVTNAPAASLEQLLPLAKKGDPVAQVSLAELLFEGKNGAETNRVEAYRWASLASAQGNRDARHLVQDFELFMTSEELASARSSLRTNLTSAPTAPKN